MGTERFTVLIYEEDATLINQWTLQYPHIETGGDLFGLWQNESEVVVQLATGAGENCRRTTTAFFQDERYLGNVGSYLTSTEGLCNIGEWHSHHSLDLCEPSYGDKQTIWRHLPECKIDRFLLFIATINSKTGHPGFHSFMFTSPENANRRGEMFPVRFKTLPGPNPYRMQKEIMEKLSQGAEVTSVGLDSGRFVKMNKKESKKEKERIKKEERKKKKKEKKKIKEEEKAKKNETKGMKKKKSYNLLNAGNGDIEQTQKTAESYNPRYSPSFCASDYKRQQQQQQQEWITRGKNRVGPNTKNATPTTSVNYETYC